MAHIPTPPTPPPSAFWWAAWYLRAFADYLKAVGKGLETVWLLGQYLAKPFQSMAYYVTKASDCMNSADSEFLIVKSWINSIVSGDGFIRLLTWASSHFGFIRFDAWSWVKLIIAAFGYYYALFIASPLQFVNQLIRLIAPHVSQFLDNPLFFVKSQLYLINSWFWYFLNYPANFIADKLQGLFWFLPSFLGNPWFFITETFRLYFPELYLIYVNPVGWFVQKLSIISDDLYWLYLNADTWLKSKFQELTGFSATFWGEPIPYLTRQIISLLEQQIETFAESLVRLAIKLILKYI